MVLQVSQFYWSLHVRFLKIVPVWLVFFDAEDNGRIEGWDWILGSREFVKKNTVQPKAVIVIDMIGDEESKYL